jgi:hypothetical protein
MTVAIFSPMINAIYCPFRSDSEGLFILCCTYPHGVVFAKRRGIRVGFLPT